MALAPTFSGGFAVSLGVSEAPEFPDSPEAPVASAGPSSAAASAGVAAASDAPSPAVEDESVDSLSWIDRALAELASGTPPPPLSPDRTSPSGRSPSGAAALADLHATRRQVDSLTEELRSEKERNRRIVDLLNQMGISLR